MHSPANSRLTKRSLAAPLWGIPTGYVYHCFWWLSFGSKAPERRKQTHIAKIYEWLLLFVEPFWLAQREPPGQLPFRDPLKNPHPYPRDTQERPPPSRLPIPTKCRQISSFFGGAPVCDDLKGNQKEHRSHLRGSNLKGHSHIIQEIREKGAPLKDTQQPTKYVKEIFKRYPSYPRDIQQI